MIGFDYQAPSSLDHVCSALDQLGDDARLIAGGTALVLLMKQRLVRPAVLVSLKNVRELQNIEVQDGSLRIGATATHRQVERHPLVREHLPVLADTLRRVATPRVRNQATLGGNLVHADPSQDPPATLLALNAAVRLRSKAGERTVELERFFSDYYETVVEPGEVLTEIQVPLPPPDASCAFLKFLPRTADDYATVAVAASLRLVDGVCRNVRLGLGSAGPTPLRARQTEALLEGQVPEDSTLRAAAEAVIAEVDPLSDVRGSADYKREMAGVFAYRALKQALAQLQK